MLASESQISLIELTPEGSLTINPLQATAEQEGIYTVSFEAFLIDIDPDGINSVPLELTISIELVNPPPVESQIDPVVTAELGSTLLREAPLALQPISEYYEVPYNKDSFLFLSFADPLAIESEKGIDTDDGESSLDYSGIAVSVISNVELNGIVKVL